jgi:soluble lytic murein transglycosylase-like protein
VTKPRPTTTTADYFYPTGEHASGIRRRNLAPRLTFTVLFGIVLTFSGTPLVPNKLIATPRTARTYTIILVPYNRYEQAVRGNPLFFIDPVVYSRAISASHVLSSLVPKRYQSFVIRSALANSVPIALLAALIDQETNRTWDALIENKNPNGTTDIGLAQANSKYLAYYEEKFGLLDPRNAEQSIEFAAAYCAWLYVQKGAWFDVMCAYKCGPNVVPGPKVRKVAEGILMVAALAQGEEEVDHAVS